MGDLASDPWNPLNFSTPAAWCDAIADDKWRDYCANGEHVEYMTPFYKAQMRAAEAGAYASYTVPEEPQAPATPPAAEENEEGEEHESNGGANPWGNGDGFAENPFILYNCSLYVFKILNC